MKVVNPIKILLNELKKSIMELNIDLSEKNMLFVKIEKISRLYSLDDDICRLAPYLSLYLENLSLQDEDRYRRILSRKCAERLSVFRNVKPASPQSDNSM